jgi:phage shock protein PspC (stress-responsive transcriptional regulator)
VLAGLCRAYGFDLRTTRIAVAIATLVLPGIALVYLAAWLLLPDSPATAQTPEQILRDRRRLPILIAIGIVLVFGGIGSFGSWFLFRGAPWGLILVAVGVVLWVNAGHSGRPPAPPAPPSSTTTSSTTTAGFAPPTGPPAGTDTLSSTTQSPTTQSLTTQRLTTHPHRIRRPIGSIGVGIAVLYVAIAAAGEALGAWNAPALWVIVTAIGIVMAALLVSMIVNQSWVLPIPFVLLGGLLLMLCIAQPKLDGGSGKRDVHPTTLAAAERHQNLAAGVLTLDLRNVPLDEGDVNVQAEVGMGRLHVRLPSDVDLRLITDVGMGQVQISDDEIASGVRQQDSRDVPATPGPAEGTIVLDLRVGMGQIDVELG